MCRKQPLNCSGRGSDLHILEREMAIVHYLWGWGIRMQSVPVQSTPANAMPHYCISKPPPLVLPAMKLRHDHGWCERAYKGRRHLLPQHRYCCHRMTIGSWPPPPFHRTSPMYHAFMLAHKTVGVLVLETISLNGETWARRAAADEGSGAANGEAHAERHNISLPRGPGSGRRAASRCSSRWGRAARPWWLPRSTSVAAAGGDLSWCATSPDREDMGELVMVSCEWYVPAYR